MSISTHVKNKTWSNGAFVETKRWTREDFGGLYLWEVVNNQDKLLRATFNQSYITTIKIPCSGSRTFAVYVSDSDIEASSRHMTACVEAQTIDITKFMGWYG